MQPYYEVIGSRSQLLIGLAAHLVAAATFFFYVDPVIFKWAGVTGLALSACSGYRHLIRHGIIRLRVDLRQQTIEIQQAGQPYFYRKYKVYQTRWFAILRLVDPPNNRALILNSDCFHSPETYRRLRFDLAQLDPVDAA